MAERLGKTDTCRPGVRTQDRGDRKGITVFARPALQRENLVHLERVESCIRDRFGLSADDLVLVSEEPGRRPGYPKVLTSILFWTADQQRYRLVVFKPVAAVGMEDLPIAWLLPTLRDDGGDCC